jgi:energy-converting hydrogenase Eha subunit E
VYSLVSAVRRVFAQAQAKHVAFCAAATAVVLGALPAVASATESASETKIKEVATQVGTEGVSIVLLILGALVGLIALVIIVPKGVKMIKRFI